MDFSGASLRLGDEGTGAKLLALLDQIDKRGQEVADRISKRFRDALGEAGKMPGLDQPSSPLRKIPKDAAEAEGSLLHMSHSSAIGLGELGRAFGKMAQSGHAGAFAMREFTGAAMRLAPGGALAGVSVIAAFTVVELFGSWSKAMDDTKTKMQELAEEHVKLMAEFRGNKVGVEELKLNDEYTKQIKDLQALRPGGFVRALSELITGAGALTGSSSLLKYGFDLYGGRNLGLDIATHTADDDRLQAEKNAQSEQDRRSNSALANASLTGADTPVEKYRAQLKVIEAERDAAIHGGEISAAAANAQAVARTSAALREFQKAVFENAAKFAADDLDKNDSIIRRLTPAWTALWEKFAAQMEFGSETRKMAKEVSDATIRPILEETDANLRSSVTFALGNFKEFEKAAPMLSPAFWQDLMGVIPQKAEQAMKQLEKWGNERIAQALGDGLVAGIKAAFQGGGIGAGIKAFFGTIMEAMGQMLVELGTSLLAASIHLAAILTALKTLNPELAIPAALALIAVGAAMEGAGSSLASSGGGSSYGGSSYGGGGTIVDRGIINPMAPAGPVTPASSITPRGNVTLQPIIIGVNDPGAQRMLQEMMRKANARGSA